MNDCSRCGFPDSTAAIVGDECICEACEDQEARDDNKQQRVIRCVHILVFAYLFGYHGLRWALA